MRLQVAAVGASQRAARCEPLDIYPDGQHGMQYVVMPRYSERVPHVGVSTIVGIVDSQESQRDALAGRPLRNRMQAIKKLCGYKPQL